MKDKNGNEVVPGASVRWLNSMNTDWRVGTVREVSMFVWGTQRREVASIDNGAAHNWNEQTNGMTVRAHGVSGQQIEVLAPPTIVARTTVSADALDDERSRIARFINSCPEKQVECEGHNHRDGRKCLLLVPMTLTDMAFAIERGEHRREEEP